MAIGNPCYFFFHSKQRPIDPFRSVVLALLYTIFSRFVFFFQPVVLHAIQRHLMDPIVIMYGTHGEFGKTVAISFDLLLFARVIFMCSYADNIAQNIQFEFLMAVENAGQFQNLRYLHGWLDDCLLAQSKHELFAAGISSRILLNYVKNKPLRM